MLFLVARKCFIKDFFHALTAGISNRCIAVYSVGNSSHAATPSRCTVSSKSSALFSILYSVPRPKLTWRLPSLSIVDVMMWNDKDRINEMLTDYEIVTHSKLRDHDHE